MEPIATLQRNDGVVWIVRHGVEDGYEYGLFDPNTNEPVTLRVK